MWTELIYRTLVLTNIVTTGDLWFERQATSSNTMIYARDEIELWQGARERTLVTQIAVDTNVTFYTNADWSWSGNDGSDTWVYSEWQPATTNWLKLTNNFELSILSTNTWSFTNENTTEVTVPEIIDVFKWQTNGTNRQQFIQGAYTNVNVSGFDVVDDIDFTQFNGDYVFAVRSNLSDNISGLFAISNVYYGGPLFPDAWLQGFDADFMFTADIYTNAVNYLAIYDVPGWITKDPLASSDFGYIYRGSGAVLGILGGNDYIWKPRLDPIHPRSEWFEDAGPYKSQTTDAGDFVFSNEIPGKRRSLYSFDVDMERNTIDGIISFRKFELITDAASNIFDADIYVDYTLATNGSFTNLTAVPTLNITQVVGRLNIDFPEGDDWKTNTLIQTTNYTTRYMMLNYADWTHTARSGATPARHFWESPVDGDVNTDDGTPATPPPTWVVYTNNVYFGIGYATSAVIDDATSWSLATNRALANAGLGTSESMTDFAGIFEITSNGVIRLTYGAQTQVGADYIYQALFCSKQTKGNVTGLNTNIDKTVSFWFATGDPELIDEAAGVESNQFVFDAYGTGYLENRFNRGGANYDIAFSNSFLSPAIGPLTAPSPWCDRPLGVGGGGIAHESYRGHCSDALQLDQEWQFTNANHFVYFGRGTTWADAQARATNNLLTADRDDDLPLVGTYGEYSLNETAFTSNYYEARPEWRTVYMVHTNSDEVTGTADSYVVVGRYDRDEQTSGTNAVFDANDTSLIDTNLLQSISVGLSNVSGVYTSAVLGVGFSDDSFPVWCDQPLFETPKKTKGYQGTNGDNVLKWDFQYCTNSI